MQGNHIHLICEAKDRRSLSRGIQGFKVRVARGLNGLWGREGTLFQDRYHDQILKTPRQVRNAIGYVLHNGRKHKEFIPGGMADPFSSAWYFEGWRDPGWRRRVLPPDPGEGEPVAKAHTWLLSTGWRRHRLLEVDESPG